MQIKEYGWIRVSNGAIVETRPSDNPAFSEIHKYHDFASTWENLQTAEWRLSPGQNIGHGDFEIQIERMKDFEPPRGNGAVVVIEGPGTFEENVRTIKARFEVNGWDFIQVIHAMNAPPQMIFTKPEGTPDVFPFAEPSVTPG